VCLTIFVAAVPTPVVEEGTLRPIPPNPCNPTPCGPNSQCQVVSGQAKCGCQPNMIGTTPNCRPECVLNSDCPSNRACINQKCVDPCPGSCTPNAECRVVNHSPSCTCAVGFSGNAFSDCRPILAVGKIFRSTQPYSFCALLSLRWFIHQYLSNRHLATR
jgi:hypothetical protein